MNELHLPKDPIILLSVVNTYLRDQYPSLQVLCKEEAIDEEELVNRFATIDYFYDPTQNQFR